MVERTSTENGKKVTREYPVYEFNDPSNPSSVLRRESHTSSSWGPRIGDTAQILYDPVASEIYEDTLFGKWGLGIMLLIFGVILTLVGLLYLRELIAARRANGS